MSSARSSSAWDTARTCLPLIRSVSFRSLWDWLCKVREWTWRALKQHLFDPSRPASLSGLARAKRWRVFQEAFPDLELMRVLDLGGTPGYWLSGLSISLPPEVGSSRAVARSAVSRFVRGAEGVVPRR
jgi:hypothetical protein